MQASANGGPISREKKTKKKSVCEVAIVQNKKGQQTFQNKHV